MRGRKLMGGDFSNIEGRINAWFAGEEWKLQAFREYDAGTGPDLYKLSYSRGFGAPISEVGFRERDIGKKSELACGYQGSIGAYLRFTPDVAPIVATVRDKLYGSEAWKLAGDQYDRATNRYGLTADEWISIKVIVNGWRDSHPRIRQGWWDLQDAAIEAVDVPGRKVDMFGGRVQYMAAEGFLWCRLPSGKLLVYCRPRLIETREDYLVDADGEAFPAEEFTDAEIEAKIAGGAELRTGRTRTQVQFEGINQKTRQWGRQRLYGGLQCNNVVQGTARELLVFAMINVEEAGYPVVLHVHDELVSEVAQEFGSVEHYQSLMKILPPWLTGLPLAAKAWTDPRYVK